MLKPFTGNVSNAINYSLFPRLSTVCLSFFLWPVTLDETYRIRHAFIVRVAHSLWFCDFSCLLFFSSDDWLFGSSIMFRCHECLPSKSYYVHISMCVKPNENNERVTGANTIYYYCTDMHACWPSTEDVKTVCFRNGFTTHRIESSDDTFTLYLRIMVSTWSYS